MLKDRLISAAFSAGWGLVCRLPESWARGLFTLGADIAWRRQGNSVQVLEGNLIRILRTAPGAEDAVDGKELRVLSRAVMRSYARYYMEAFRLPVMPMDRIGDGFHVNLAEAEAALDHMKDGRGVIFALPHMGDFEQAGLWVTQVQKIPSFTTVMERLKPEDVYEKFLKFREGLGMEVLATSGGPHPFGVMARRLREGKMVCLVADRDLSGTGVEVDFFGEKALMPAGPAALAVQTGAALYPVSCWFVGETEWGAHVYPEVTVPAEGSRKEKIAVMTQALAARFEEGIREHPQDWHMLQKLFLADLDPARLARRRSEAPVGGPA